MPFRPNPPIIGSMATQRAPGLGTAPTTRTRRRRRGGGDAAVAAPPRQLPRAVEPPARRASLDTLASHWQRAFDTDERALHAAVGTLPPAYLSQCRRELAQERRETALLLADVARAKGIRPLPWLSPAPVRKEMLGLTATTRACLFDLDGVLTDSALLHASAWAQVLDEFLLRVSASTGWHFIPFDRDADYRTFFAGRSRLEGIHAFLDSRGIRLPEGRAGDPADADTVSGLAKHKGDTLVRGLQRHGVTALPGVHRYLDAAGRAGLTRAVVSASASTSSMLELAALGPLVEVYVDADVIRTENIRTPPSPEVLLAACRRLDVRPQDAVTFTHTAAGVAAGLAAGMEIVGVGHGADAELLRGFGAPRIISSLSVLLAPSLTAGDETELRR